MHVVLNAQLISARQTYRNAGVSSYGRGLIAGLDALVAGTSNLRITALTGAEDVRPRHIRAQSAAMPLHRPLSRIAWEQLVLHRLLHELDADIVHGLVNVLPLASNVPSIVTVHDLSFVHLPGHFPATKRLYLSALCRASVRKADAVLAVSRQTADDVIRYFKVSPDKVTVIHNGVDERFTPCAAEHVQAFRREKRLPARFFLFIGTLEPRKNLETLLIAYAQWRAQASAGDRQVKLVVAGGKGWHYDAIFTKAAALGLQEHVLFPGFVPDDELPLWYSTAESFVYPSLFEGFGLPVLEAMACGAPVLCSSIPSLREVAAEAALFAPPHDVAAWANGLHLVATQPALRRELSIRGIDRAGAFSWQTTAQNTIRLYRDVCLKASR